jgi:hypothetical protein
MAASARAPGVLTSWLRPLTPGLLGSSGEVVQNQLPQSVGGGLVNALGRASNRPRPSPNSAARRWNSRDGRVDDRTGRGAGVEGDCSGDRSPAGYDEVVGGRGCRPRIAPPRPAGPLPCPAFSLAIRPTGWAAAFPAWLCALQPTDGPDRLPCLPSRPRSPPGGLDRLPSCRRLTCSESIGRYAVWPAYLLRHRVGRWNRPHTRRVPAQGLR